MKQAVRLTLTGLACGVIGWPCWLAAIGFLESLPANARPDPVSAIVTGAALLLPGLIFLAWRFDKHGAKGLGWAVFGVCLGTVLPVALFVGLLMLIGPITPRG
ncbi:MULTISPECIES: hypothetical protein [unclassified Dyella]|uniref:hypothetical protein n=1 Tax=unclassified Dyella TaxID=2634549 RepID=UPI000C81D637|nr:MULTISPECIES: hypothetical protein [unclassified Dyella]MDR3446994.1 hypothetical protein [Dyella sp.]PMQ05865.1 hypothetical protein DyAD56_06365 [Dyella sp. AD56]